MSDRSPHAQVIFHEAREKYAPDQWAGFLDQACAGDAALRAEVEALLREHLQTGSFHDAPRPHLASTIDHPPSEDVGASIGPYKLLQKIGEGGMGAVYMAEQNHPVQRMVALKIIKPGMDSRQVIARFESERQALALMDHPNIAKVLDAGTTEAGRPYFVMEMVKGVPITHYCDERHLTFRERLELFVPVCQAVLHAHQKGIIHRDIKPSNVLIALYDDKPVPKVIDFGVAKATGRKLTELTLFTEFGQVVGTLEYMSPEQAGLNQLDIDTRSDLYSLGVVLYELLTGSTPLERKRLRDGALLEMLRLIREEEPPKPSTRLSTTDELPTIATKRGLEPKKLSGFVRGELDWIVMKALEKDRTRRYETAGAFAADVQRFLDDEPVEACPPSAGYRLRKFVRKYKKAVTLVTVFAILLVGSGVIGIWQELRAREAAEGQRNAEFQSGLKDQQRIAAEKLADLHKYHSTVRKAAERVARPQIGDLYRCLDELKEAAEAPTDARDLLQLRELAARSLAAFDIRTIAEVAKGIDAFSIAFSPDGKHLATGENVGQLLDARVAIFSMPDAPGGRPAQVHDLRLTRQGLAAPGVRLLAFSPDGRWLVAGARDGSLHRWDLNAKQPKEQLWPAHSAEVISLAFKPDGRFLVSCAGKKEFKVWETATWKLVVVHATQLEAHRAAYSPDGEYLLVNHKSYTQNHHAASVEDPNGKLVDSRYYTRSGLKSYFSPDGKLIAHWFGDGDLVLGNYQPKHDMPPHGMSPRRLHRFEEWGRHLAFSADNSLLVTANGERTVQIWETATGRVLATMPIPSAGNVTPVFSPDGHYFAVQGDKVTTLYEVLGMHEHTVLAHHQLPVQAFCFASDGRALACIAGNSYEVGKDWFDLSAWNTSDGKVRGQYAGRWPNGQNVSQASVAFHPNSKVGALAAPPVKGIYFWDASSITLDFNHLQDAPATSAVSFERTGKTLWGIVPTEPGEDPVLKRLRGSYHVVSLAFPGLKTAAQHRSLATSAKCLTVGQRWALAGFNDGSCRLFPVDPGAKDGVAWRHSSGLAVRSVALNNDETLAASGDLKGDFQVGRIPTGETLWKPSAQAHGDIVTSLAFSPDGKLLASGSRDRTVQLWQRDRNTFRLLMKLPSAEPVLQVAFTPDGKALAILAENECGVHLWHLERLKARFSKLQMGW